MIMKPCGQFKLIYSKIQQFLMRVADKIKVNSELYNTTQIYVYKFGLQIVLTLCRSLLAKVKQTTHTVHQWASKVLQKYIFLILH